MKKIILLSLALLGVVSTAQAGFEVEPNDSSSYANLLPINEVLTGDFIKGYCNGNNDYYRFSLPEAKPDVAFHFRNITDNSKTVYFYLYDSAMKSISIPVKNVNLFTKTSVDFKQNLAAGTYFFRLSSCSPVTDSKYELSVSTKVSVTPSIVSSTSLPDLNANGSKDIAFLRILEDASIVVETRDGDTGEMIDSFPFIESQQSLKPVSIIGFGDSTVGDLVNFGVLVYNSTTKTYTQHIINAKTGDPVTNFDIE